MAGRTLGRAKKAETENRTVVFIDETGFYMLPSVVKAFAPEGETPVVKGSLSRDHVSAISAVTPEGQLLTSMQEDAFDRHDIVDFLRHVLGHIEGKVLIIWDGLPAHRSNKVRDFLSETAGRVYLEQLPSYAPDLNPDEGIWQYLKNVELTDPCTGR